MKVAFAVCDCCGRYLVQRIEGGGFEREQSHEIMVQGHVFDVCEPCAGKASLAVLFDKRKLIAEQNAELHDPLGRRPPENGAERVSTPTAGKGQ